MATTTKKRVGRPARTKAEVQQEFTGIRKEVESALETADAKASEFEKRKEEDARRAVEGVTVEGVVQRISGMGLEITRALAEVSEKLVAEVNRLSAVREAVALEQVELERLHKIDVAATALDQLVQEYGREKAREEAEIAGEREEWEQEKASGERERKEQEEALKKQRQREAEEFEYKKGLERKKAQDKYEEEQRLVEKKNQEKQESLEKSWQQREAALKGQEEELQRLRKESEQFPARLKKETDAAAAQAAKETAQQMEQQMVLLKKDAEAEVRLADLRIRTLEESMARQAAQLVEAQKQLTEAKQQVQEIAVKAIEGASGSRALAHVNQIAIEQAKQRTGQG